MWIDEFSKEEKKEIPNTTESQDYQREKWKIPFHWKVYLL